MTHISLAEHYRRACDMLRESIQSVPDTAWRVAVGDSPEYLVAARQALHVVTTIDFYNAADPSHEQWDEFPDWEGAAVEELPGRGEVLELLDRNETAVAHTLAALGGAGLARETAFPWTGETVLDTHLYNLRHIQHHVAVLNTMLRIWHLETVHWK